MPDRIVAGTWAVAAAMTRGDVTIRNADAGHLSIALEKLVTAGAEVDVLDDGFRVVDGARARRPSTSSRFRTRGSRPTCSRSSSR